MRTCWASCLAQPPREHAAYPSLTHAPCCCSLPHCRQGGWRDVKGSVAMTVLQYLLGGGGSFSAGAHWNWGIGRDLQGQAGARQQLRASGMAAGEAVWPLGCAAVGCRGHAAMLHSQPTGTWCMPRPQLSLAAGLPAHLPHPLMAPCRLLLSSPRRPGQGHALAPVHARAEPVPLDAQLHRAQLHLQQHRPGERCWACKMQDRAWARGAQRAVAVVALVQSCFVVPVSLLLAVPGLTPPSLRCLPSLPPSCLQVGVFASAESSQAGEMVDVLCKEMQVKGLVVWCGGGWVGWGQHNATCACRPCGAGLGRIPAPHM